MAQRKAQFVNRPLGTGTRVVLADLMAQSHLHPEDIVGFDDEEPSHNAVAQAVAQGQADVGLGIASAALAKGLDFVALCQEHDLLVCHANLLQHPAMQALGGHDCTGSGDVGLLHERLPWWSKSCSHHAQDQAHSIDIT